MSQAPPRRGSAAFDRWGTFSLGRALKPATEIGAATGIEFLTNKRFLAAAEPVRRGGGRAGVVDR